MSSFPSPVTVLTGLFSGLENYLIQKHVQGELTDAFDEVGAVEEWLGRSITAIATYDFQEQGAVKFVGDIARQIGHDLEQIQGNQQAYWDRLFDVILPNSFSHLVGYVYSDGIVPLRVLTRDMLTTVNDLVNWRASTSAWINDYATPLLKGWQEFIAWWNGNFSDPAATLIDWLKHPAHFGEWAAAPVTGPVIAYLAQPEHKQSRDNLAELLVGAWAEDPDRILAKIETWLVSEAS